MPVIRTYACPTCGHFLDVTLTQEQLDDPPPDCPVCSGHTAQEFKAPAIVSQSGRNREKARQIAQNIAAEDYNVADMNVENYAGVRNKVRYKDQNPVPASSFQANRELIEGAIAVGREQRLTRYKSGPQGSGIDVLQGMLRTGEQPDLIKASVERSRRGVRW